MDTAVGGQPVAFPVRGDSRTIGTFGQVPTMDAKSAGRKRELPFTGRRIGFGKLSPAFGPGFQIEEAADAFVFAAHEPNQISKRSFRPANLQFGWTQSNGSSRHFPANFDSARGLKLHAAAPRLCFQIDLPAAESDLLNASLHRGKCERLLVIPKFEVQP